MHCRQAEVLMEFAEAQERVRPVVAAELRADCYRVFLNAKAPEWRDYIRVYMREYRALNHVLREKTRRYMQEYNRRPEVLARAKAWREARKAAR